MQNAVTNLWEGHTERWSSLNSWKTDLSNAIAVGESKDAAGLTVRNALLNTANSPIELWRTTDIVRVCKHKRLLDVKTDGNNVLGI